MLKKIYESTLKFRSLLNEDMTRKTFLKTVLAGLGIIALSSKSAKKAFAQNTQGIKPRAKKSQPNLDCDLSAVSGSDPELITRRAIDLLGGMSRFVKRGDIVALKPNISWNLAPQYAANTNPAVVAAIVKMCLESGAKSVKVFDNTLNDRKSSYENSGIMAAARGAGANVFYLDSFRFAPAKFENQRAILQDFAFSKDALDCDVLISAPVAKHHGQAQLSLGLKNLIGLMGNGRGQIHWNLDEGICELNEFFKPDLYVIDANAVLTAHGPRGGNLSDVVKKNTVAASADGVLADAYSAKTFFNRDPQSIPYISLAAKRGLGKINLAAAHIKTERN